MVRCSGSTMAVKKEPHQCLFCKHLWWIQKLPSLDLFLVALQWKHISSQKAETAELNRISDVLNNLREHFFQLWSEAGPIAASIIQWGCSSVHFQKNASCYCMPATKHRTWTVLSTNKSLSLKLQILDQYKSSSEANDSLFFLFCCETHFVDFHFTPRMSIKPLEVAAVYKPTIIERHSLSRETALSPFWFAVPFPHREVEFLHHKQQFS